MGRKCSGPLTNRRHWSLVLAFSQFDVVCTSDSLETILSHLSTRVMDVIRNGSLACHLYYLLEFLAAWEKRPGYLTQMAWEWCSAISEAAGRLGQREIPIIQPRLLGNELESKIESYASQQPEWYQLGLQLRLRRQGTTSGEDRGVLYRAVERGFSKVGPGYGPVRSDDASRRVHRDPLEDSTPLDYAHLLSIALEIGFRLVVPGHVRRILPLNHTPHHDRVFETAFSSGDDDVIADAVSVLVVIPYGESPPSFVRYLAKRMERDTPFSPRLRRVSINATECFWRREIEESRLEIVRLLNRLDADVDDIVGKGGWGGLLADLTCSQAGSGGLSPHNQRLLDNPAFSRSLDMDIQSHHMEVMRSLEAAGDWEKLEDWIAVAWRSWLEESIEDVGRVTLKLLSRRPSALPRFEDLCETRISLTNEQAELRRICGQVRVEQRHSESLPL